MSRIGVFVCHCGMNIKRTVDTARVVENLSQYHDVVLASEYEYMCSDPGQKIMQEAIRSHRLDGVVVAALCSGFACSAVVT